jgi:nucleoside-diphosphate-sugar epimerase
MKLLILGGTRFLGRHLVTAALARNHETTLFNRGNHPSAPSGVETICGDRNSDLAKLTGRRWDAVVDTCGYLPRTVRAAAEVLADSVERYVFISSQSVYADLSVVGVDETAPLATLTNEQLEEANAIDSSGQTSAVNYGKMYGGLKALCEQAAEAVMPNRVLAIRPGLIVGPDDYTDRFTYWVVRVARGGEVLAPGRPERYVQFIDVRDLAEWIVRMVGCRGTGPYNANGLPDNLTMESVLEECKTASGSDATFTWETEEFLLEEEVSAWSEMPLWLPEAVAPHLKGFMFINSDKAVSAGLKFRPLSDTVRDTLRWHETNRVNEELKAGIDGEREETLLRKWHERNGAQAFA